MPMVYTQFFIGSEIFDLLRSSQYTPSVSPCGLPAPSEREPGLAVPFIQPPGNRNVAGDFHRPYGTQMWVHFSIQRTTLPQSALAGVPAPSEREPGKGTTIAWVAILRTIPELCRRGGFQGGKSPPLKSDKKVSITLDNGKNPWYTVRRLRKKAGIVYA